MTGRRPTSGSHFDVPFHLVMCVLWIVLVIVKLATHFSNLVCIAVGAALGVAAHGLSVFYGLQTMRELAFVYRAANDEREAHDSREATLEAEIHTMRVEAEDYRSRIVELQKTQRPTKRDPKTGRYAARD